MKSNTRRGRGTEANAGDWWTLRSDLRRQLHYVLLLLSFPFGFWLFGRLRSDEVSVGLASRRAWIVGVGLGAGASPGN